MSEEDKVFFRKLIYNFRDATLTGNSKLKNEQFIQAALILSDRIIEFVPKSEQVKCFNSLKTMLSIGAKTP